MKNLKGTLKKFEEKQIPIMLNPYFETCFLRLQCGPGCIRCHGSKPGCNNPPIINIRDMYLAWVHREKIINKYIKINLLALDFIWQVGNMRFRQYRMPIGIMSKTEAALMDLTLHQRRINKFEAYFTKIPDMLQSHVTNLSSLTLSRDQAKLICDWVEDVFLIQLPMGARKKMLMTSIALSFLINRLVPNGNKRLILMMFHAVFNKSLVQNPKKRRQRLGIHYEYFLDGIFPPPKI
jgi:hypothetical protein